jgi:hypothetical protein
LFESLALLLCAHVADDGVDLVIVQSWDCRHVAEVPVVLLGTVDDCGAERVVAVMVWFVHDRQVRRPLVGATQVGAVTGRTIRLIERRTIARPDWGRWLGVAGLAPTGGDDDCGRFGSGREFGVIG